MQLPAIAHASIKVLDLLQQGDGLREKLRSNAEQFRREMGKLGFKLAGAGHPIIPVMLGDASLAQEMANRLLKEGIYVIGFSFPVVPKGEAFRLRCGVLVYGATSSEPLKLESAYNDFIQSKSEQP